MLDQVARRYRTRPSSLLAIEDPERALDFDLAACTVCRSDEQQHVADLLETSSEDGSGGFYGAVLMLLERLS